MTYCLLGYSNLLYVVNTVLIHISSEKRTYFFECRVVDWVAWNTCASLIEGIREDQFDIWTSALPGEMLYV